MNFHFKPPHCDTWSGSQNLMPLQLELPSGTQHVSHRAFSLRCGCLHRTQPLCHSNPGEEVWLKSSPYHRELPRTVAAFQILTCTPVSTSSSLSPTDATVGSDSAAGHSSAQLCMLPPRRLALCRDLCVNEKIAPHPAPPQIRCFKEHCPRHPIPAF